MSHELKSLSCKGYNDNIINEVPFQTNEKGLLKL